MDNKNIETSYLTKIAMICSINMWMQFPELNGFSFVLLIISITSWIHSSVILSSFCSSSPYLWNVLHLLDFSKQVWNRISNCRILLRPSEKNKEENIYVRIYIFNEVNIAFFLQFPHWRCTWNCNVSINRKVALNFNHPRPAREAVLFIQENVPSELKWWNLCRKTYFIQTNTCTVENKTHTHRWTNYTTP